MGLKSSKDEYDAEFNAVISIVVDGEYAKALRSLDLLEHFIDSLLGKGLAKKANDQEFAAVRAEKRAKMRELVKGYMRAENITYAGMYN